MIGNAALVGPQTPLKEGAGRVLAGGTKPFLVFGLPRSRTAWLSVLLRCPHDTVLEKGIPSSGGVSDTGVLAMPVGLSSVFGAKVAIVRDERDCFISNKRLFGVTEDEWARVVELFHGWLDKATLKVGFEDLNDYECCNRISIHCKSEALDYGWWDHLSGLNISVTGTKVREIINKRRIAWRQYGERR